MEKEESLGDMLLECINNPNKRVIKKDGIYLHSPLSGDTKIINSANNTVKEIMSQEELRDCYKKIKEVLTQFIDTKEENLEIISLWILGTWMHDSFPTYPYLFINAMKGSGKTRLLKLIKELSYQGDMLASLSEAVLFRTTGTLCIDEFEGIGGKDKNALRELLNTAYKKGGKVKRMKKVKTPTGEEQIVDEFSTYRPIVMANISGMEEVLADRCISIVLEKSGNSAITRKIENFSDNELIKDLKNKLSVYSVQLGVVIMTKNMYTEWNDYVDNYIYNYTTTHTTLTTLNYTKLHLFEEIYKTNIDGRNLELTFPLFMMSEELGNLDKVIGIIKNIVEERKENDFLEGKDVQVLDFVSKQSPNDFYKVNELTNLFKNFISYESEDEKNNWLNNKWLGKSLQRLNIIKEKKRNRLGIEVILNVEKAIEKMKIFR